MPQRTHLVQFNGSSQRISLGGNFVLDNNWFLTAAEIIDWFFHDLQMGKVPTRWIRNMQIGVQKQEILLTAHILSCILLFTSLAVFSFSPIKQWVLGFYQFWLCSHCFTRKCSQDRIGATIVEFSSARHHEACIPLLWWVLPPSRYRLLTAGRSHRSWVPGLWLFGAWSLKSCKKKQWQWVREVLQHLQERSTATGLYNAPTFTGERIRSVVV